jgi:hypothetical protein
MPGKKHLIEPVSQTLGGIIYAYLGKLARTGRYAIKCVARTGWLERLLDGVAVCAFI